MLNCGCQLNLKPVTVCGMEGYGLLRYCAAVEGSQGFWSGVGAQVTLARVVCVPPRGGRLRCLDLPGHRLCYNESGEMKVEKCLSSSVHLNSHKDACPCFPLASNAFTVCLFTSPLSLQESFHAYLCRKSWDCYWLVGRTVWVVAS